MLVQGLSFSMVRVGSLPPPGPGPLAGTGCAR